jgi:hypothetical protein
MRHAFAFGSTALAMVACTILVALALFSPAAVLAAPPAQEATPAPAATEEAGTTPTPEAAAPTPTAAPDMGDAPAIDPNVPIPATGTELAAAPIGMLGAIGLFILLVIGVAWLLAWEQRRQ